MTKTLPKLVLSASRDIPFSQLVLSQKNVRRVKAGLSIEDLAEDIYRRTLLQSINVRPLLDADGKETGMFEVPAGGRRLPPRKPGAARRCRPTSNSRHRWDWHGWPGLLRAFCRANWCSNLLQARDCWPSKLNWQDADWQ